MCAAYYWLIFLNSSKLILYIKISNYSWRNTLSCSSYSSLTLQLRPATSANRKTALARSVRSVKMGSCSAHSAGVDSSLPSKAVESMMFLTPPSVKSVTVTVNKLMHAVIFSPMDANNPIWSPVSDVKVIMCCKGANVYQRKFKTVLLAHCQHRNSVNLYELKTVCKCQATIKFVAAVSQATI